MLTPRADLGIAQTVFYVPMAALAVFLLVFRNQSPRFTWYCLMMFSAIRLAGGVVNIILEQGHQTIGVFIAALILLSVGSVPLITSTFFFAQMILRHSSNPADRTLGNRMSMIFRVVLIAGVALFAAGGSLISTPADYSTAEALFKTAYILLACVIVFLIFFTAYLWTLRNRLERSTSMRYLTGTTLALPFLIVRIIYAFLSIFDNGGKPFYESKWSYLAGSLPAYILMGLVMEYVVVFIFLFIGLITPPLKNHGRRVAATSSDQFLETGLDGRGK